MQDNTQNPDRNGHINQFFFSEIGRLTPRKGAILDLGTTRDYIVPHTLKQRFPKRDYQLVGLDIDQKFMQEATQSANGEGINFVIGDMNGLPFQNSSIDTVTAKNKPYLNLQEVCRVLKSGGFFIYRGYGPKRGFSEIANLFPGRVNLSQSLAYHRNVLDAAGFREITLYQSPSQTVYHTDSLLHTLEHIEFLRDFSQKDKERIAALSQNGRITITTDPIVITAKKPETDELI